VPDTVLDADNVVNAPVFGLLEPIDILVIAPKTLGEIVIDPVGERFALPVTLNVAPIRVVNVPAAAVVPPIAGGEAKYVEKPVPDTVPDADRVVNAPELAVVDPIAGGEDK
jgi:hypothetical protein